MVTIIDYGVGNIGSIANMLKKIGAASVISRDPEVISRAEKIILCGIGSFDDGMARLEDMGLVEVLKTKVREQGVPILGVCLGMQLLTGGSEEGRRPGLGLINAYTRRFNFSETGHPLLRIPHMGWNEVEQVKPSGLGQELGEVPRFYFVHSYHVCLEDPADELFRTRYGFPFTAAFEKGKIMGVQFHPEKSHRYGMRLYENFIKNY